jgi:DNA-binding transcriptional regulator YiaG
MGKVENALRDFIQYHGRKAARDVMEDLPDRVRDLRNDVRALRGAVEAMQDSVEKLMEAHRERMAVPPAPQEEVKDSRVTKRTLKSLRKRFNLTQEELAELLDVSSGTVTLWETGKTRPQEHNAAKIITLREMSKSEVDEVLGRTPSAAEVAPGDIRELRERLGLTQKDMAELLEVSSSSITNWEAGRATPGRKSRKRIEQLHEMSAEEAKQELDSIRRPQVEFSPREIRGIRKEMDLSQAEFGEKLGVSPGTVSNWETGTSQPRSGNVAEIKRLVEQEQSQTDGREEESETQEGQQ